MVSWTQQQNNSVIALLHYVCYNLIIGSIPQIEQSFLYVCACCHKAIWWLEQVLIVLNQNIYHNNNGEGN